MTKPHPLPLLERERITASTPTPLPIAAAKKPHNHRNSYNIIPYSPKLSHLIIFFICFILFILLQIKSLHLPSSPYYYYPSSFIHYYKCQNDTFLNSNNNNNIQYSSTVAEKLRDSITFLPLKDLRYSDRALQGHTWFMSSMYDIQEEGEVQYQQFPSNSSKGRLLCLKGRDTHDGSWNYYALAWPDALPQNSTFLKGLTFVSYNHYDYANIWHGLSATVPFIAWHIKNDCELPSRWVLYHWGELRLHMSTWLSTLLGATFNGEPQIEAFDGGSEDDGGGVYCFEKAVVMRHNEGGMSRDRRIEAYGLVRCKARTYCNVSKEESNRGINGVIGMTLFMRTGPRSFRNDSAVIRIFQNECAKVDGCKFMVAYANNLTVCEQVKLMSMTDILISPHGAQLTNMFLMDRNSSVMEFFPKGWLKLAGVGQYVYHWMASWSGMRHQGAWRDPDGDPCPYPENDRRCMSIYKGGTIGYNKTYFSEWARNVLKEVKSRKMEKAAQNISADSSPSKCACS